MKGQKKITLYIPNELLRRAQESTGKGLTATVRKGLELVASTEANKKLRQLRGRVRFSIDVKKLREDRL